MQTAHPPAPPATIVLVHGLGRTPRAMRPLERAARARGYRVINVGYASRTGDVAGHATALATRVRDEVPSGRLHVVTHSLGGIVLRQAVASGALPAARIARVVMLAPPSRGSEIAELLWYGPAIRHVGRAVLGPSGAALATRPEALVHQLPPVPFEVGVIAGARSWNPVFSWLIPGPDDGKVAVARAAVPGMRAMVTVPRGHTFLMRAPDVIAYTFTFLEHGRFEAPGEPTGAVVR